MREDNDNLLNVVEVAERLACSVKLVRRLIDQDELAARKIGRLIRVSPADLADYIDGARIRSQGQADQPKSIEEDILAVLDNASRPVKGSAIARRCGRKPNAYFRSALSQMVKSGKIQHTPEAGYASVQPTAADSKGK